MWSPLYQISPVFPWEEHDVHIKWLSFLFWLLIYLAQDIFLRKIPFTAMNVFTNTKFMWCDLGFVSTQILLPFPSIRIYLGRLLLCIFQLIFLVLYADEYGVVQSIFNFQELVRFRDNGMISWCKWCSHLLSLDQNKCSFVKWFFM